MLLKRLLKGTAMVGIGVLLLFTAMGGSAGAESYSLSRQIIGLNAPLGVAVGSDGRVFVADQSNFRVVQFDEYGNLANQCLFQSSGYLPLALAVAPNGEVYYVTRFGPNADLIKFSSPDSCGFTEVGTPSQFTVDYGVAVAPDGSVFVSDFYNDEILKFGADGTFIKSWGTQGSGVPDPDACSSQGILCGPTFNHPKGMAIYAGSYLLVADSGNNRIEAFDLNGNFILSAGAGESIPLPLNSPDGVAADAHGNIYISDTGNNKVEKFSIDDGTFSQIDDGTLSSPEGLAVDKGGNVYVVDSDNDRVDVFTPDIVVFENGSPSKVITGNAPFGATFSINPDAYWNNAPVELFLWLEAFGVKAYWAGLPLDLVLFNSLSEMKPVLSGFGVPSLSNVNLQILSDSSVLPAGTYTLHLCLDRDINGTFNPSASVCGSINIVRQ
ncbi:MAG: NHL repeat-containing protein [Candidatus Sulfobium sp.]